MKKSDLIKIIKEELRGWSPQIGQTKGLTPDTLNKILTKIAKSDEDEVGAGKKIDSMSEGQDWPDEVPSRHGDIIFKLIKVMPDRAKYALLDAETGKEWEPGGRVFGSVASLMASAEDTIMPQGGRQSTNLGEDKSDAIRWFGNVKYYYTKAFVELKGEDRETYRQMVKDYFSKL